MSNLPTKFIIAILAVGILIGAATTTTIMSAGLKPFSLASAQLRFPFQFQPRIPLQQQPQFQAPLQQQSPVPTTSANKVSISTTEVPGGATNVGAGGFTGGSLALCPTGSVVTGGGHSMLRSGVWVLSSQEPTTGSTNGWSVVVQNNSTTPVDFQAFAVCATVR
jgi:hypothetical protein